MPEVDVRIKKLEPMRVASFKVVSENPENDVWEKLKAWADAKGYLGNVEEYPIFGFNNPGPSPNRRDYGYELWIRVPSDTEPDDACEIKDFPGGLYAITTHKGLPNPEVWMDLWKWVQSSSYEWRQTNELEKPLDPLASPNSMIFDLYLPIKGGGGMESFQKCMDEYRKQLGRGAIQEAYKGLMQYVMGLRTHFMKTYPDYSVSGSIYYGFMDMTYFSVIPKSMKDRKLKIAIVFLHETSRFEAWLSGVNRQVQTQYWELVKESGWNKYQIVPPGKGVDSIIEKILVSNPDFTNLGTLTKQIERETLKFIQDIESFLSKH